MYITNKTSLDYDHRYENLHFKLEIQDEKYNRRKTTFHHTNHACSLINKFEDQISFSYSNLTSADLGIKLEDNIFLIARVNKTSA